MTLYPRAVLPLGPRIVRRHRESPRREPGRIAVPVALMFGVIGVGRSTPAIEFVAGGSGDLVRATALSSMAC